MSDTGARCKNAKWDEDVEVFQMMEFLATNTSKVGDGGNFPATWYNQAADHIAAFKGLMVQQKQVIKLRKNINMYFFDLSLITCLLTHLPAQTAIPTHY